MLLFIINKQKELKAMTATQYNAINLANLTIFLEDVSKTQPPRMAIKLLVKNLNLDIKDVSLHELLSFATQVQQRTKNIHRKQIRQWHFNRWTLGQQKLFSSILPYFCYLHKLSLQQLNETHLRPLQSIFVSKSSIQLYFQIKYLDSLTNNFKISWNQQDSKNLTEIVTECQEQKEGITKWKNISLKVLVKSSGLNFHSPRDCRQMWTNHLNPKVSKDSWDLRQDYQLFAYIKEFGCKWSLISKKMKKMRTEHMVKNRVNSYIRKNRFKSKHLTNAQLEQIIGGLQKQITRQQEEKGIFKSVKIQHIMQSQEQLNYFTEIKYEIKSQQAHLVIQIFDVLDLPSERIVITSTQIEDSWQYNEDAPMNYFNLYENIQQNQNNSIFDQLILPKYSIYHGITEIQQN